MWCSAYCNGAVRPYYLNNKRVQREDCYQIVDPFFISNAQHFLHNAVFQQEGDPPHILSRYVLYGMKCIQAYGEKDIVCLVACKVNLLNDTGSFPLVTRERSTLPGLLWLAISNSNEAGQQESELSS